MLLKQLKYFLFLMWILLSFILYIYRKVLKWPKSIKMGFLKYVLLKNIPKE